MPDGLKYSLQGLEHGKSVSDWGTKAIPLNFPKENSASTTLYPAVHYIAGISHWPKKRENYVQEVGTSTDERQAVLVVVHTLRLNLPVIE